VYVEETFVAKLSGVDAAHTWSKGFGGTTQWNTAIGLSVVVDPNGNVLVTGPFRDTVDFGGGPLTSAGEWDIFLLKLHP